MTVKIDDVMTRNVLTVQRHHTIAHARGILERNGISALPVVDGDGEPLGIITATDLIGDDFEDGTPISKVMTEGVYQVPQYNEVAVAAGIMKKRHIHHLVVTHERKVVGIVSSFDLLAVIADARFVMKERGTKPKKSRHARA